MKLKLLTTWMTLGWLGVTVSLNIQPSLAQIAPSGSSASSAGSLEGLDLPRDERDTFPNSSSLLDLINRLQSINSGSSPNVAELDAAAAEFRARQRQRLQGQQQPLSPGAPQQINPVPVQ